ncbi:MAG TPA: hypothetical protein VMS31_06345 [Pyrinomonadaceae bacterium]|nr:hypothetical protein [Pyrinomonadaceae bacterium]
MVTLIPVTLRNDLWQGAFISPQRASDISQRSLLAWGAQVALLEKSAKPTNESSPPIHRWDQVDLRTQVREADD